MRSAGGTRLGRRGLLAAASATFVFPAIHARAQANKGAALVIGNSRYQWEASLPNVKRDAPDIAKHFQGLGLRTELIEDAGRDAMNRAIHAFNAKLKGAELGALYFAGHGAQWVKDSYIVPIDADLSTPNAINQLVPVESINHGMGGARHRLMVFDNCRNNPADGWGQVETQRAAAVNSDVRLQNMPPPNTLILFSTAPGRVALDGPAGQNSPFCSALMRQLEQPMIDFVALPAALRRDLLIATEGKQVIWDKSSYDGSYQLPGAPKLATAGRNGWSNPARVVELNGAYAFAAQASLPMPPGLIAHRTAKNSRDAQKIGSYKFTAQFPGGKKVDQILIVMSVEEGQVAECIVVGHSERGPYWRFVTASINGNSMDYVPRDNAAHFTFTWNDANGGAVLQRRDERANGGGGQRNGHGGGGGNGGGGLHGTFVRLDG